jgi:hypothetical protein
LQYRALNVTLIILILLVVTRTFREPAEHAIGCDFTDLVKS